MSTLSQSVISWTRFCTWPWHTLFNSSNRLSLPCNWYNSRNLSICQSKPIKLVYSSSFFFYQIFNSFFTMIFFYLGLWWYICCIYWNISNCFVPFCTHCIFLQIKSKYHRWTHVIKMMGCVFQKINIPNNECNKSHFQSRTVKQQLHQENHHKAAVIMLASLKIFFFFFFVIKMWMCVCVLL